MKLTTLSLVMGLMLAFGPAQAQIDDNCLSEIVVETDIGSELKPESKPQPSPPQTETKEDYSAPAPAPQHVVETCATPRDGLDSADEGERVMCRADATAR